MECNLNAIHVGLSLLELEYTNGARFNRIEYIFDGAFIARAKLYKCGK